MGSRRCWGRIGGCGGSGGSMRLMIVRGDGMGGAWREGCVYCVCILYTLNA